MRLLQYTLAITLTALVSGVFAEQASIEELRPYPEKSEAEAQYNLGIMYDSVIDDDKEAMKWYRRAAEQGHEEAQYKLGMKYLNTEGRLKDSVMAYAWLNVAGANGNLNALENKSKLDLVLARETKKIAETLFHQMVEANPQLLHD